MTRIAVFGPGPLPFEDARANLAPGMRTWQFSLGLAQSGHEVTTFAVELPQGEAEGTVDRREEREGVQIQRLGADEFFDTRAIREALGSLRPEALVGATLLGSSAASRADLRLPFWADQFGHAMAEAQARSAREEDNSSVAASWRIVKAVLTRADKISVISGSHRYAVIGELGALGRLNAATCGYEFTQEIPCATFPERSLEPPSPTVRGVKVPQDAFLVLWSGSFNVWTDVATLFEGLEMAMRTDARIHFVSTGGAVDHHDRRTYSEFERRVANSPLRERFHLEGWVRSRLVGGYLREADLGVVAERETYEGLLGSKNRILRWIEMGLPVLCNRVGELTDDLASRKLVLTFTAGDSKDLCEKILASANQRETLRTMANKAASFGRSRFSVSSTTEPLVDWVTNPQRAPDAGDRRRSGNPLDYGSSLERLAGFGEQFPRIRESRLLRSVWRRLSGQRRGPK